MFEKSKPRMYRRRRNVNKHRAKKKKEKIFARNSKFIFLES